MSLTLSPIDVVFRHDTLWTAISFHGELSSTNDYLVGLPAGAKEGLVVVADATEGHGRWLRKADRLGRTLLVSFLIRFSTQRPEVATAVAGLALLHACQRVLPSCALHWPHGLYAGVARLGGVRIDVAHDMLAVGIGLDVDMRGVEAVGVREGTSLAEAAGADVDRWALLSELMLEMDRQVRQARADAGPLLEAYRARCSSVGRTVTVRTSQGERVTGRGVDIDPEGRLVLEVDGSARIILGGEVVAVAS